MNLQVTVNQEELLDILLNIAPARPVFIWGAPGIGKSALVEEFAIEVGLDCVSLLGSQLAPEDIIGIPQIKGDTSEFLPPKMIARKEPYVLFLDELNACSQEVQKAFYSLIYERRIGEYLLPEGSIVIGAGNRAQDAAIVKTMSSALINRMFHVQLKPDVKSWLTWAYGNGIHPWVTDYISQRPDHLFSEPPKTEEPFSTPRSWHMLSDALKEFGAGEKEIPIETIKMLAYGSITASHAGMFAAFVKQLDNKYLLEDIIKGTAKWPEKPEDRDVLYFLAQAFRARLIHDLPQQKSEIDKRNQYFAHRAKALLKELAQTNYELAQMVVSTEDGKLLPEWFVIEVIRDLPRLVSQEKKKDGKTA
ncbi:MAG: AAA family ATPase [Butyrivibrio sp.]|nr:AAA family ATPase [Butyrivibrio sp.]